MRTFWGHFAPAGKLEKGKKENMTKRDIYIQTYQHNSELLRMIQEEMEQELLEIVVANVPPSQKITDNINVLFKSFIPF